MSAACGSFFILTFAYALFPVFLSSWLLSINTSDLSSMRIRKSMLHLKQVISMLQLPLHFIRTRPHAGQFIYLRSTASNNIISSSKPVGVVRR